MHQLITAYQAAGRAGTKRQKSRAEVRGGGRKPHSQKGTGRARAGSIRSPIWVGGGRAFAARPRDYEQKVNRKMYRAGMRSMLAQLARTDRLIVTESLSLASPRTKLLVDELKKLSLQSALIVIEAQDEKLELAARNLPQRGSDHRLRNQPGRAGRVRQGAGHRRRREADRGAPAMSRERLATVLVAPHITEKTALAMQNANQYAFKVRRDANKTEIKQAVEMMFEVKVAGVQVSNEPGKDRRFGNRIGRTQDWKKAYVKLAAGQAIDYEAQALKK